MTNYSQDHRAEQDTDATLDAARTQRVQVRGVVFTMSAPYKAGDCINAIEARLLNREFAIALRTRLIPRVQEERKQGLSPEAIQRLQAECDALCATFAFTNVRVREDDDPILAYALKLARDKVLAHYRKKGHNVEGMSSEQLNRDVAKVAVLPSIQAEAIRRFEAAQQAASLVQMEQDEEEEGQG